MQVHLRNNGVLKEVVYKGTRRMSPKYRRLEVLYRKAGLMREAPVQAQSTQPSPSKRPRRNTEQEGRNHLPTVTNCLIKDKKYTVELSPRGDPVQTSGGHQLDVRKLLEHLLLALMYLHQHKLAHRDVRLPNVVHADGRYYLIDLEEMAPLGEQCPTDDYKRPAWGEDNAALVGGCFKASSDLYSLGLVLKSLLEGRVDESDETQNLCEFRDRLLRVGTAFETAKDAYDVLMMTAVR